MTSTDRVYEFNRRRVVDQVIYVRERDAKQPTLRLLSEFSR